MSFAVSILTRPEGRVQSRWARGESVILPFQSSPGPKAGCNHANFYALLDTTLVSILTRPEGRVQLIDSCSPRALSAVSILTRPEGRVQSFCTDFGEALLGFNPHPARRPGAMQVFQSDSAFDAFQSSPGPKAGCNRDAQT